MKLHVDLGTGYLIEGPGFRNPVTSLRFKRGDAATLEVVFLADGTTVAELANPANLEMHFGVKARGRYDGDYLVHTSAWTLPSYGAVNPVYRCSPSFNTEELNDALGVGSATGTEFPELVLMGEITWRVGAADPTSTRTFVVVVENDVNRGTEGVPTSAEPPYPAPDNIEFVSRKGAANGYAGLDSTGKVPWTQIKVGKDSMDSAGASVGQVLTAIANNQAGWETPETKGAARHAGQIVHSAAVELAGGNGGDFATTSLGTPPPGECNLVVLCTSHVSYENYGNELYISDGGTGLSYVDLVVCDDGLSPQTTATELVVTLPDPVAVALPKACVARFVSAGVEMFVSGRLNSQGDTASLTLIWIKGGSDALAVDAARQVFGKLPAANLDRSRKRMVLVESDIMSANATASIPGLVGNAIQSGTMEAGTGDANHPGVVNMKDNTLANGGYGFFGASSMMQVAGGEKATMVFRLLSARSTITARFGYIDTLNQLSPTDGVWLELAGGQIRGRTANSASLLATATNGTCTVNRWYTCVLEVNADASATTFRLYEEDGPLQWSDTISGGLPTSNGRETGIGLTAHESTTDAGVAMIAVDYVCWEINRDLVR